MKEILPRITLLASLTLILSGGSMQAQSTTPVVAEATVQFSTTSAPTSFTNTSQGYDKVKSATVSPFQPAKSYFKFDFTGLNPNTNADITMNFVGRSGGGSVHINLWSLDQTYPGLTNSANPAVPNLSWYAAQANNTNGTADDMYSLATNNGSGFTATFVKDAGLIGTSGSAFSTKIPAPWGSYLHGNQLVIVLTATNDAASNSGGFRALTNSTTMTYLPLVGGAPPSISTIAPQIVPSTTSSSVIVFTLGDPEDGPNALTPVISLGNTNVSFTATTLGGSGANRTLQFVPVSNKAPGTTVSVTVTLTVTDSSGNSANSSFLLTVPPFVTLPELHSGTTNINSFNPTNMLVSAAPLTIPFTVVDTNIPAASLVVTVTTNIYSTNILSVSSTQTAFGSSTNNCTMTITPSGSGVGLVNVQAVDSVNSLTNAISLAVMVLPNGSYAVYDTMNYKPSAGTFASASTKVNLADASAKMWNNRSTSGSVEVVNTSAASGGGSLLIAPIGAPLIRGSASGNSDQLRLAGAPYRANGHQILYACLTAQWADMSVYSANASYPSNSVGAFVQFAADGSASGVAMGQACTIANGTSQFNLGLYQNSSTPPVTNTAYTGDVPAFDNANLSTIVPDAPVNIEIGYDTDTGISTLWVNGTSSSDVSSVSLQDVSVTNLANVSYLVLRQNAGMGNIIISHAAVKVAGKPFPTITGVNKSAGTVIINYTDAAGVGQSANQQVWSSSAVNGTYSQVAATINDLGAGNYSAVITGQTGATAFYKIKEPGTTPTVAFPF